MNALLDFAEAESVALLERLESEKAFVPVLSVFKDSVKVHRHPIPPNVITQDVISLPFLALQCDHVVKGNVPVRVLDKYGLLADGKMPHDTESISAEFFPEKSTGAVLLALSPKTTLRSLPERLLTISTNLFVQYFKGRSSEKRQQLAEAVLEISESVTGLEGLTSSLAHLCQTAANVFGVDQVSLFLIEDGLALPKMAMTASGEKDTRLFDQFLRVPQVPEIVTSTIHTNKPVYRDSSSPPLFPSWWNDAFGYSDTVALIPLTHDAEKIGLLVLQSSTPHSVTPGCDIEMALEAAPHISRLISQLELNEERRQRLRSQASFQILLELSSQPQTITQLGQGIATSFSTLFGSGEALLVLLDKQRIITRIISRCNNDVPARLSQWKGQSFEVIDPLNYVAENEGSFFIERKEIEPTSKYGRERLFESPYVMTPIFTDNRLRAIALTALPPDKIRWSNLNKEFIEEWTKQATSVFADAETRIHEKSSFTRARHRALHDPLTELPNRDYLLSSLTEKIATTRGNASRIGVLYIDLDNFKQVNDTMGHHNGDLVLQEIARRLKSIFRGQDFIGRLAGDEFAAIVDNVEKLSQLGPLAQRMLEALSQPIFLEKTRLTIYASVGISISGQHIGPEALLRAADLAMYQAKKSGGATYAYAGNNRLRNNSNLSATQVARWNQALDDHRLDLKVTPVFPIEPVTHQTNLDSQVPDGVLCSGMAFGPTLAVVSVGKSINSFQNENPDHALFGESRGQPTEFVLWTLQTQKSKWAEVGKTKDPKERDTILPIFDVAFIGGVLLSDIWAQFEKWAQEGSEFGIRVSARIIDRNNDSSESLFSLLDSTAVKLYIKGLLDPGVLINDLLLRKAEYLSVSVKSLSTGPDSDNPLVCEPKELNHRTVKYVRSIAQLMEAKIVIEDIDDAAILPNLYEYGFEYVSGGAFSHISPWVSR